jgi:hypothetical protein
MLSKFKAIEHLIYYQNKKKIIRLALKEQKRKELYAKQGRGSQFTSRDQRDTWIQNELKSLSKAIKEKNEQIERLQEDLKVSI